MNKKRVKIFYIILLVLSIISINIFTLAHSGRTDSRGEHKDNKNKSGLGSYHYHCGGYPAHLHSNGVCPYSVTSSSSLSATVKNDNNKTSSINGDSNLQKSTTNKDSVNQTTQSIPNIVEAESIEIVEGEKELKVGEVKQLSVNILPDNTTNKKVIWESSNENVITVSENGKITAINAGQAYVTVSTLNKRTDSICILVNEDKKESIDNSSDVKHDESKAEQNVNDNQNGDTKSDSALDNTSKTSDVLAGFLLLSALGAGYLRDKKR